MLLINSVVIPGSTTIIALPVNNNGGFLSIAADFAPATGPGQSAKAGTVQVRIGKSQPRPLPLSTDPAALPVPDLVADTPLTAFDIYDGVLMWDQRGMWRKQIDFPAGSEVVSIVHQTGGPMAAIVVLE